MSLPMTEFVEIEGHRVEIRRHPAARQMRLSVDPRDGHVRLTLPKRASARAGVIWARDHIAWIEGERIKLPQPEPIRAGMEIPLADEMLMLVWNPEGVRAPRRIGDGLNVGGAESELPARVLRWLRREALQVLTAETQALAAKAQVVVRRVGIGDAKARWGSCSSKGDIRYSWRLILMPSFVRRATVAHEVAHRVHMNHSAAFHALAAELLGADPKPANDWLRRHGASLHWFGRDS